MKIHKNWKINQKVYLEVDGEVLEPEENLDHFDWDDEPHVEILCAENSCDTQLVGFLGSGQWSYVFEGSDGMAYVFVREQPQGDLSKMLYFEITRNYPDLIHIPKAKRVGVYTMMEYDIEYLYGVYQMPIYNALQNRFRDVYKIADALQVCAGAAAHYRDQGEHWMDEDERSPLGHEFQYFIDCMSGELPQKKSPRQIVKLFHLIPESLLGEIEILIEYADEKFDLDWSLDPSDGNLAMDNNRNLILLDIMFGVPKGTGHWRFE